jgi:medium-chain acyl-[acyl-carrier-protein] hydrolase
MNIFASPATADRWIFRPVPRPHARLRLFCFPYAGGGASIFRQWAEVLPENIELLGVRLPGRENRISERAFDDWQALLPVLADMVTSHADRPYALFGHSLGGAMTYEITRAIESAGGNRPELLIVSGIRSPETPLYRAPIFALPLPEFIAGLRDMNGTPAEILDNRDLMAFFEPTLRADIRLADTWSSPPDVRLGTGIVAFSGTEDHIASEQDMRGWQQRTSSSFAQYVFEGDHFFIHSPDNFIVDTIAQVLAPHVACGESRRNAARR